MLFVPFRVHRHAVRWYSSGIALRLGQPITVHQQAVLLDDTHRGSDLDVLHAFDRACPVRQQAAEIAVSRQRVAGNGEEQRIRQALA